MASTPKTTVSLGSPYPRETWPVISHQDQLAILDLLVDTLNPIGQYRAQHVIPSKGKRAKKKPKPKTDSDSTGNEDQPSSLLENLKPDISKHVTVGYNSTMRYLESLAQQSALTVVKPVTGSTVPDSMRDSKSIAGPCHAGLLAAVFIPQSDQSPKLFAHLPLLIRAGNVDTPSSMATRLVLLPKAAEARLSTTLTIPRVGIIGLTSVAAIAQELIDMVRVRVPLIQIPWLEKATAGEYLPVNIEHTRKVDAHGAERKKGSEERDKKPDGSN